MLLLLLLERSLLGLDLLRLVHLSRVMRRLLRLLEA